MGTVSVGFHVFWDVVTRLEEHLGSLHEKPISTVRTAMREKRDNEVLLPKCQIHPN